MRAAELREKTSEELNKELLDLLREQFNLRMQQGTGQFSRHDQFSKVRKDIARIKTVLNERSMASIAS
ncbi:MAG: 50S ribosomal protein L29 [Pseudomonadota bacterium]